MKRTFILLSILVLGAFALPSQSVNLKAGLFIPSLSSDLWDINLSNLAFEKADLQNANLSAEFEFFLNRFASFGLEIGNYSRTRYTQYRDYEYNDGTPIYQNVALEITPIEALFTFYMLGHRTTFSPYLAVGGGIYVWKYEQWGDFIDFSDPSLPINEGYAVTKAVTPGFSARVGFLFRPQRMLGFSIEGKYQYAKGSLSGDFADFEPLDLSGLTLSAGIHIYFD
jgi:hypothetical protein